MLGDRLPNHSGLARRHQQLNPKKAANPCITNVWLTDFLSLPPSCTGSLEGKRVGVFRQNWCACKHLDLIPLSDATLAQPASVLVGKQIYCLGHVRSTGKFPKGTCMVQILDIQIVRSSVAHTVQFPRPFCGL